MLFFRVHKQLTKQLIKMHAKEHVSLDQICNVPTYLKIDLSDIILCIRNKAL